MTIDPNNPKHLIADTGKVLFQKSTGRLYGSEVYLGKIIVNGEFIDDYPENFIEVYAPYND